MNQVQLVDKTNKKSNSKPTNQLKALVNFVSLLTILYIFLLYFVSIF